MHLPRKSQIKFLIQIFVLFNFCLLTISLCSPFYAGLEILFPLNISHVAVTDMISSAPSTSRFG